MVSGADIASWLLQTVIAAGVATTAFFVLLPTKIGEKYLHDEPAAQATGRAAVGKRMSLPLPLLQNADERRHNRRDEAFLACRVGGL
jgi:hypothetical protein